MSKSNISVGTQGWADRINAAWRKSALAYIETGQILIDCKKTVAHGDWADMLENGLDFDATAAQRLMKIARDRRITNPANLPYLPKQLSELTKLTKCKTDDEFERRLRGEPAVTEAEFYDVDGSGIPPQDHLTQSPGPHPGVAVSAEGESSLLPHAPTLITTPHDDREGGDSVVIPDDGLQGHYRDDLEALAHEASALADSSREGMIAIWIDPYNPMSIFTTGLMLAMDGRRDLNVAEAAAEWPENMALLTDHLHEFTDWLIEFEAAFRVQHGNGNAAARLRAAQ
jgi:hypothetical protein